MTIIGVNWAGNASSPTLTRIGHDGTNGTYTGPASGGTLFNSFGTWENMRRVNLWDDGTVTSTWGTRCYIDTNTGSLGQVMVQIPAFLCYMETYYYGSGEARFYIADMGDIGSTVTLHSGLTHTLTEADTHQLFVVDGNYVDYAYVSAFEGYLNQNTIMIDSVAGVTPTTFETNTVARSYAEARDTGWELMNIQALSALQLLYIIEYASLNSQSAIGNGITGAGALANTGATGTTGTDRGNLSYGTTGNSTTAMSYRGIENLWGNQRTVIDGLNVNTSLAAWIAPQSRTRPTYYQWADYASPYVSYGTILNGAGGSWIKAMIPTGIFGANTCYFLPITGSGSASTYFCDETWMASTGNNVLVAGGLYNDGTAAGIFAQRYEVVDTVAEGARLQYIPSAE